MISCESSFRVLSLCTPQPGAAIGEPLLAALAAVRSWNDLMSDAEEHGLETLLLAHAHDHGIELPPDAERQLRARWMQHAHAARVRTGVVADALDALQSIGIPALVLKGAALAQLVYVDPRLRPMRDVDLLVPSRDAPRAWQCLRGEGFVPSGMPLDPDYHHLQSLLMHRDGATITIEVHKELLRATAFVRPLRHEDLASRAQTFDWGGRRYRTLGREDMLWHVYADAFVVNVLRPGIRLISIADVMAATERWADVLDWDRLRRTYPRLVRALPRFGELVAWSRRVTRELGPSVRAGRVSARGISSAARWRDALSPVVWWPSAWWFDVRYGVDGPTRRLWHRLTTHPASLVIAAARTARTRTRARGVAKTTSPGRRSHVMLTADDSDASWRI